MTTNSLIPTSGELKRQLSVQSFKAHTLNTLKAQLTESYLGCMFDLALLLASLSQVLLMKSNFHECYNIH